jgi:hypothetical protein
MKALGVKFLRQFFVVGVMVSCHCAWADPTYNFLWVVGNADSMASKRAIVQAHFPVFVDELRANGIDEFRMAITDTDFFTNQGQLVASANGLKVVSSSSANVASDFNSILAQVGNTGTAFWPQGLESAYQAILLHNFEFMEKGPLVVIYLSDHNDYSCEDKCYGIQPEDNHNYLPVKTSRYGEAFKLIKNFSGQSVILHAIVGKADSPCTVPTLGTRYIDVQNSWGVGSVQSICDDQLAQSLDNIAQSLGTHTK